MSETTDRQYEDDDKDLEPSYTNHNGYCTPMGFPIDGFASGLAYQARPNDLFVATYPKCGTTWMQHIVYLLLNNGTPIQPHQRLGDIYPFLEKVGGDVVQNHAPVVVSANHNNNKTSYRLIKTHLYYDMTPMNEQAKYIVVTRNPKDCVVSFFHHTKGFDQYYNFARGTFDTYFQLFIRGRVDFGDYFQHLRSWMDRRNDPNVLMLTFEDLKTNGLENLNRIAKFLHVELDPNTADRILKHSSIDSMKQDPMRWTVSKRTHTPFVRTGKVHGWGELLSPEQACLLDRRMMDTFSKQELDFLGKHYYSTGS